MSLRVYCFLVLCKCLRYIEGYLKLQEPVPVTPGPTASLPRLNVLGRFSNIQIYSASSWKYPLCILRCFRISDAFHLTDAFKSAAQKSSMASKIPGSKYLWPSLWPSLWHCDYASVAASFQSRYETPTKHTQSFTKTSSDSYTIRLNSHNCGAPDRRSLNGSMIQTVPVPVVVVTSTEAHHACLAP